MDNRYEKTKRSLSSSPRTWLVTGVAGFIGSNLLQTLLTLEQTVVGLDNFATGHRHNLDEVCGLVGEARWGNFRFIEGDIRDIETCRKAVDGVDYVLHQAALGSVPRSIEDPLTTNAANVTGFINMLVSAKDAAVDRFVYAASSSTYGDHPALPKVEDNIGNPLSPYAVTKYVNELYADVFNRTYDFASIGLRYFNVFGPRQDPDGAYAAVIPKWVAAILRGDDIFINGDGQTSRDFCFIDNVVQANILSATAPAEAAGEVYNVALNDQTNLVQLFETLKAELARKGFDYDKSPVFRDFRKGDVMHSRADISKAGGLLGYDPQYKFEAGVARMLDWYIDQSANQSAD